VAHSSIIDSGDDTLSNSNTDFPLEKILECLAFINQAEFTFRMNSASV
jgi:hypothetical protein